MTYVVAMFPDNRIRELRKRAGLTQSELGAKVGLHQTQIGKIENNDRNLTIEWARRIAEALNTQVADILGDKDNPMRLDDEEKMLIQRYREANAAVKTIINRVVAPLNSNETDDGENGDRNAA